ncbi:MAG: hypothetical protein WA905_10340, partial [Pseudolabrys sp.]
MLLAAGAAGAICAGAATVAVRDAAGAAGAASGLAAVRADGESGLSDSGELPPAGATWRGAGAERVAGLGAASCSA